VTEHKLLAARRVAATRKVESAIAGLARRTDVATERMTMRQSKEILRQKWVLRRRHRAIALSVGVSAGSISRVAQRAEAAGLTSWSQIESLDEEQLERQLYGIAATEAVAPSESSSSERIAPDCEWIHRELLKRGVTLALLHVEYLERHPNGLRRSAFNERYAKWLARRQMVMRQPHVAGDKMFVDYSGKKPALFDPLTGEVVEVELFVAVLGASNYTYAEASATQSGPDWIASHVRALEYFGGAPRAIVCDQLKSGVTRSCRYEPEVQRTYEDLAVHYGTTVLPARARKPRDKAKVEVAVQVVQRWVLARIRNERFQSIAQLNARLRTLIDELNRRIMRHYGRSRRALFEEIERDALSPLPASRFEYVEWKRAKVNLDYHIVFDHHFYSVPFAHVHHEVWVRASATTIEILRSGRRIASHVRSSLRGKHTTKREHMPSAHRAQAEWSPSRILSWAGKTGPSTRSLCEAILAERPHPEQGFRSCLGILRLEKQYGAERLEAACTRALRVRARSYKHVESILRNGLDRVAPDDAPSDVPPIEHENLRGPDYYIN
jgi:transposase